MSRRSRIRPMVGVFIALLVVPACARDDDAVAPPPVGTDVTPADVARYATEHGLSGLSPASLAATPEDGSRSRWTTRVEVAETGSRFAPDEHFVDADGVPTRGNYFVTEGYVYRRGTLTCDDGVCDGVLYDAAGNPSPEFPAAVIGTWTCYGTHTEDAGTTRTGPVVVTTQVFDLGPTAGAQTVVSSGFELADVGVAVERAIVGGTGRHSTARGTQTQRLLGLNNPDLVVGGVPLFGVSLRVTLETR